MNIQLRALIDHFLTVVENLLNKEDPDIFIAIETELKLLVIRIENLLLTKPSSAVTAAIGE
jgi:hypothetical protein